MVGCAKARSLVVLDRATRAFRDLERHAAHLRGQGLAAPNELTVALAAARLHEERAWKVVSFADRLLLATSPRGGKGNKSFGDVLKSRLGWFERGEWAQLYRDVDRCRRSGGSRGQKQARQRGSQSLRGRARRVTALLREGEWGKATSAVMAKDPPRKDRGALRELRALFPSAATEAVGQAYVHMGYNAAKGAVRLATKSAAVQFAADGIRVNSVHPGIMPPMKDAMMSADPEARRIRIAAIPAQREGRVEEVAYANLFLASDEASYITGIELPVDGGYLAI
jgi:hypothetical protein